MDQSQPDNNFENVGFRVTPIYTLFGRKNIYSLGDMSYGEFAISQNGYPKYYLNCFDKQYEPFLAKVSEQKLSVWDLLERKCRKLKNGLTVRSDYWGIRCESKASPQKLIVEKLPITFFDDL
jgi:hypothetical protein